MRPEILNSNPGEAAESIKNRDGEPRDRYASKNYRDVIGEDTRKVLKNKQRLRKAAEAIVKTSDGRFFIKEGVVIGRTYTDGEFEQKKIRDEDTAVIRPCLGKRLEENTIPNLSRSFSVSELKVSDEELQNLQPNEYPTGNYMKLVLRTAEDGTVTPESGEIATDKDNVIEDCEDYIEIDQVEVSYNTLKFLYIGGYEIYANDIGGQLAALAQNSYHNIIAVCAYDSSGAGSIVDGSTAKTIYWNAQREEVSLYKDNLSLGDILYEDWGTIDRKGKWDYIMISSGSESTIKDAYETVGRCLKDSKNFIIYCDDGNPQNYSGIAEELKCSVLGASVVFDNYPNQSLISNSAIPSGVKQYIAATCLYAKFYGTSSLISFVPVYNADNGTTKDFYKEAEYEGGGDNCNVNRARAREIQTLVVEHYEDGVLAIN